MKSTLMVGFGATLTIAFFALCIFAAVHSVSITKNTIGEQVSGAIPQYIIWVRPSEGSQSSQLDSFSWKEKQGILYVQSTTTTQAGGTRTMSEPIPHLDFDTFLVAPDRGDPSFIFIKDSEGVYLIYLQGDAGGDDISIQSVSGADPSTFRIISYEYNNEFYSTYATDKNHVYGCDPSDLDGCIVLPIAGADPSTFHVVDGKGYDAQDKTKKYYAGRAIN
jgi:hypothetical protein